MLFAQAADAVRRKELVLIEHASEDARELVHGDEREDVVAALARL